MFDYTLAHWLAFLSAAVLLNLTPGPDMAFIVGQAARHGVRKGFAAMFGVWIGAFLHVLLAALGLSAILAASATAFSVVKWIGAAYLIWLGLSAWRGEAAGDADTAPAPATVTATAVLRRGVLVAALNPKVAVFFLAFLPQFVTAGAGPASAQLFLHGSLIIAVAALVEPLLVLAGGRLARALKSSPRLGRWMDRALGSLFVALGIRLATASRG
ncbi:Homoserine/homoserine lactone efflux protein [wastewater metagenome]|uniref:Homoserine/homoserine lactone efflux protein n=2 Tax=unclassified sequences TaxID=12908 RepID=A0A5B8REY6_9ZZZZ|nr:LysE family translocator [Arhodomonas sp. KWT]QEA06418.1 homoserine/homoserine lactone efflux protein [uncultured organism]